MKTLSKQKHHSSSKKTKPTHQNISFAAYGVKPRVHQKSQTLKLRISPDKKHLNQDYDFPQFAIYSKDKPRSNKTKENATSRVEKTRVSTKQSQREAPCNNNPRNKKKGKMVKIEDTVQYSVEKSKKNDILANFQLSLGQCFQLLDIFSKGVISQANVSNWVPEFCLYFLGKPLQHIKTHREVLNKKQFTYLCFEMLKNSCPEDILEFIQQTKIHRDLKKPIRAQNSPLKQQLSPIRKRMIEEELNRSKKMGSIQNKQLNDVLRTIQSREQQIKQKIKETQEEKKKIQHPLQESTNNQTNISPHQLLKISNSRFQPHFEHKAVQCGELPNIISNESVYNVKNGFQSQMQPILLRSPNKYHNKLFQGLPIGTVESRSIECKNQEPFIANFTFQLPQGGQSKPQIDIQFQINRYKQYLQELTKYNEGHLSKSNQKRQPLNIDHYKEQVHHQEMCDRYRFGQQDDIRLDRLKDRIESYMKKNAEKIQKSRSFFIENSPNRLRP